jgi:lysyl-tRNA synthetase, class II
MTKTVAKVPRLVGAFTYFVGLFNVISNVGRRFRGPNERLDHYFVVYLNSTAFATTLFTGLLLILLARGLRRGKKRARNIAIVILCLNIASEFFRFRLHPTQLALSLFLLLILVVFRGEFAAKSDPTTKFRTLYAFFAAFIFFFIVGVLLFYTRHSDSVTGNPNLASIILTVLAGFVWLHGPVVLTSNLAEDTIYLTLGIFGIFILLIPLWAFLRRVSAIPVATDEEKAEIASLVRKFGDGDSLSFFATRDDKSVVWSNNRQAGIAYRVQSGVMLASGDPFGEPSLWPEAISNFLLRAREFGWTPAVMGASERGGRAWIENAELSAIEIGDEAIIDVNDFSLEGRPMSNVRQTINKAKREGFTSDVTKVSMLNETQREDLRKRAVRWRGDSIERGFSMSMDRFMGELDRDSLLVRGFQGGELVAFLYFVPWGKVGYSLDRMQRAPQPFPGITELMILSAIESCKAEGLRYLSLNFAAFRSIIERAEKISAGPILRTLRALIRFFSGWFQVESLYRFNSKFQPEWNARYILYPGVTELSAVIWSALRAEKFIAGFGRRSKK